MILYSAETKGFYDKDFHKIIPEDAVEITLDERERLLKGQEDGKEITPDVNGRPILTDPAPEEIGLDAGKIKKLLRDTDYQALPDYQKSKTKAQNERNMKQRAEWRLMLKDTENPPPVEMENI